MSIEILLSRNRISDITEINFGIGKRGLLEKGSFQENPFLEILETLEILELLENAQTVGIKGESDHFARDSRDSSSEKTPFVMTPFFQPRKFLEPSVGIHKIFGAVSICWGIQKRWTSSCPSGGCKI